MQSTATRDASLPDCHLADNGIHIRCRCPWAGYSSNGGSSRFSVSPSMVASHLDVASPGRSRGASTAQQVVDLVEAGGVVHLDLHQHLAGVAGGCAPPRSLRPTASGSRRDRSRTGSASGPWPCPARRRPARRRPRPTAARRRSGGVMIVCSTSASTIVRFGLVVHALEQPREPVGGQEQAHLLVVRSGGSPCPGSGSGSPARRPPRRPRLAHAVVGHHARLDAGAAQLAQQLQADVGDDLDVHPRVVVDLQARDRVDVGGVPQRLQRLVAVDALDQVAQRAVAACRQR